MTTQRDRDEDGRFTIAEVELEERRSKVVALKVDGYSFREIGAKLGINEGTACRDYRAVIDRTKADADETVDEERRTSLARIAKAIKVLMPMVEAGTGEAIKAAIAAGESPLVAMELARKSLDAMDRLVKLEKERAMLLGTYAPTRTEVDATVGGANPAVAARLVRETFGEHAAKRDSEEAPPGTGEVPEGPPGG